ncbi:F-box and associated interaction domains-containing protein [Euphorbia peplus]|nr:F-box and associated interaction domains-containing protein [Euphorbia peplus]
MALFNKHLPDELMADIFSRVPVKQLVRCKAVAKPWHHYLTFSTIPKSILQPHLPCVNTGIPTCPNNQSYILLTIQTRVIINGRPECKLLAFGGGTRERNFSSAYELNSPLIRSKKSFQIKTACCNGMMCVSFDDDNSLVLWNPSTGEHKTLPVPEDGIRKGVSGLGYDPTTDDYKVVSVLDLQIHVLSMKSNSWEKTGGLHFPYFLYNEGIPINGCIYWSASKANKFGDSIIRLSLSDLKVSEVPIPPYEPIHELILLAWGNSLCLYRLHDQSMWTLEEEQDDEMRGGIRYVWTHRMTLPRISHYHWNTTFPCHNMNCCPVRPRCFTKRGRLVVLVRRERYVLYDSNFDIFQDLYVYGLSKGVHSNIVYTESLISPHSV